MAPVDAFHAAGADEEVLVVTGHPDDLVRNNLARRTGSNLAGRSR